MVYTPVNSAAVGYAMANSYADEFSEPKLWKFRFIYLIVSIRFFCLPELENADQQLSAVFHNRLKFNSSPSPNVSIIVPVWNTGSKLLQRSLSSIRNQTFENIEIIVIDDCSIDDSWEFIRLQAQLDNRLRIYRNNQTRRTLFSRTTGVRMARGEYIMYLDPDDEMLPNCVSEALACAEETGADVVDFQAWEKPMDGEMRPWRWLEPAYSRMDNQLLVDTFVKRRISWSIWRKIFRRSVYIQALDLLGDNGYLPYTMSEDLLHCGAFFKFAKLFVRLQKRLLIYYTGQFKAYSRATEKLDTDAMAVGVAKILTEIYGRKMYGTCI